MCLNATSVDAYNVQVLMLEIFEFDMPQSVLLSYFNI